MAFPGFSMVTSHHQMENYLGENHGGAVDTRPFAPGSVSYMQLFQAFPAEFCDDALAPEVTSALQAIQDAKTAATTVTAENLLDQDDFSLKDGAGEQADAEEKSSGEAQLAEKAEHKADLHTELEKYAFAAACPTRFYAYTLLSEDQLTVMNDQAIDRSEMAESSAYIYRYELCVSESVIDYSMLGGERSNPQEKDTHSTAGSRSAENMPATTTAAGKRCASDEMQMGVFCVSPVNLAMHRSSARCTPIQASIEVRVFFASFQEYFCL